MAESIKHRTAALHDYKDAAELRAVLNAALRDITALQTSLNQLITDYNANATIATDTTAAAVTLTLTN